MKINLAGMEYHCHSPSLFELAACPGTNGVWLACQGPQDWAIALRGTWQPKTFKTVLGAAQVVGEAFHDAVRE
jgi:hypothetical protein